MDAFDTFELLQGAKSAPGLAMGDNAPRRMFTDIGDFDERLFVGAVDVGLGIEPFVVGNVHFPAYAGEGLENDLESTAGKKHDTNIKD
jgi:hypothetical protein